MHTVRISVKLVSMSDRENVKTFAVITYREDAGIIYRLREVVRDSYHTEDGGYLPQRVIGATESVVYSTDADAVTAVEWITEASREF